MQAVVGLLFFMCLLPLPGVKLPDSFPLLPTLAILYLGVGVTMLSFLLYNFAVRSVPASRTAAVKTVASPVVSSRPRRSATFVRSAGAL